MPGRGGRYRDSAQQWVVWHLVARARIELATVAYETTEIPFLHLAIWWAMILIVWKLLTFSLS